MYNINKNNKKKSKLWQTLSHPNKLECFKWKSPIEEIGRERDKMWKNEDAIMALVRVHIQTIYVKYKVKVNIFSFLSLPI